MSEPITGYKYIDEKGEHLHTFENKPLYGTSSVVKVLQPPLAYWASGHAVKTLGVTDPKVLTKIKNKKATPEEKDAMFASCDEFLGELRTMTTPDYIALMGKAYAAHATSLKESADDGTDLHASLELFVKEEMQGLNTPIDEYPEKIRPVVEWSRKNVKHHLWSEANCFSIDLWCGGISDWGVELNDGRIGVIDFKSAKDAYQSHFWQCAGYDMEISENGLLTPNGELIARIGRKIDFYAVIPFGAPVVAPVFNDEIGQRLGVDMSVESCREAFKLLLGIYKKLPSDK